MLLGIEADQHLVVARRDEQTGRRDGYGKRIGGIDRPRVIDRLATAAQYRIATIIAANPAKPIEAVARGEPRETR